MNTFVTVNDTKYKIPTYITVEQWQDIYAWGLEDPKSRKMVCAVILGTELNTFKDVEAEDLEILFSICLTPLATFLEAPKTTQPAININELTFGQFIDLDALTHDGLNQNMAHAISILYDEEIDKVLKTSVEEYWTGITQWLEVRKNIYRQYSTFFDLDDSTSSTNADDETPEKHDVRRVWYQAVIALAGEDFMKVHQVVERPVFEAMNFLSYLKDQAYKREQQNRANRAKLKSR